MVLPTRRTQEPRRPLPQLRGWTRKFSSFLRFQKYRPDEVPVSSVIVALDGSGDFDDIQAAVDSLPQSGGKIIVKPGTYNITSDIDITKDNVVIIGSGISSKITTTTNNLKLIDVTGTRSGIIISNLFFFGNGSGLERGIRLSNITNSIIENCIFENCGAICIQVVAATNDCFIRNNICKSNPGDAIIIVSGAQTQIINNIITECNIGIQITRSNDNIISGNNCFNNVSIGIRVFSNSNSNTIDSNQCTFNAAGINILSGCNFNVITNNTITNNSASSIFDQGENTQIGHNITDLPVAS